MSSVILFRKVLLIVLMVSLLLPDRTQAQGNIRQHMLDLANQGNTAYFTGRYNDALVAYQQALPISRQLRDPGSEAKLLSFIGRVYIAEGQYPSALDNFNQALVIVRKLGDAQTEGQILESIGLIYSNQGQFDNALDTLNKSFALAHNAGNSSDEEAALDALSGVYYGQGQFTKALEYLNQALSITRKLNNQQVEGILLGSIGVIYGNQGQFSKALDYLNRALALARQTKDRQTEGACLGNIGMVYSQQGLYAKSLDYLNQGLGIDRQIGNRIGEATRLNNIGGVYLDQGQYSKALDFLNQALAIFHAAGAYAAEGSLLNNIGNLYSAQKLYSKALDELNQALAIHRQVGNRAGEATTLHGIGYVYSKQGQYDQALNFYSQALVIIRQQGERFEEGRSLSSIGNLQRFQGHYMEALEEFSQALVVSREINDRTNLIGILAYRGLVYEQLGQRSQAIADYRAAVDLINSLFGDAVLDSAIASLSDQGQNLIPFQRLAVLLTQDGDLAGALNFAESGRAILARTELSGKSIDFRNSLDKSLLDQESALKAALTGAQKLVDKLRQDVSASSQDVQQAEAALEQARQNYDQLLETMQIKGGFLSRQISHKVAALDSIQAAIPADTTLILYTVGDLNSIVFLVTNNTLDAVVLNVKADQIAEQVAAFNSDRRANVAALSKLYDLVIAPIASKLKTKRLMIAPDGALNYVPFAALPLLDSHDLIDHYAISMIPSATALVLLHDRKPEGLASSPGLVLAQPSAPGLPRLVNARMEAEAIAKLLGVKANLNASENDLRSNVTGSKVLHISAHAELDALQPLYSAIDLKGDDQSDGRFEIRQIYELDLTKGTDLVILSGCDTASGGNGEDFGIMTRAFFAAGTPRVVASLWSVDDEATAFMITSYIAARAKLDNEADSLQAAMLATREKYPEPYLWASFVLSGLPQAALSGVFSTPQAADLSTAQTKPTPTQQAAMPVAPTPPPTGQRTTIPSDSHRLGVFQVERYCTDKGDGITLTNNQRDWACTNKNGTVAFILQPSDFDAICAAKYHPGAFAILDQKQKVQAYNWSCYEWVK